MRADQILARQSTSKAFVSNTLQIILIFLVLRVIMIVAGVTLVHIPVIDPMIMRINEYVMDRY